MKRLLIALLAVSFLLAACSSSEDNTGVEEVVKEPSVGDQEAPAVGDSVPSEVVEEPSVPSDAETTPDFADEVPEIPSDDELSDLELDESEFVY